MQYKHNDISCNKRKENSYNESILTIAEMNYKLSQIL